MKLMIHSRIVVMLRPSRNRCSMGTPSRLSSRTLYRVFSSACTDGSIRFSQPATRLRSFPRSTMNWSDSGSRNNISTEITSGTAALK